MNTTSVEVLEVLAESTSHATPFATLGEYMEGYGDGFSIREEEIDVEAFSEASIGLMEAWTEHSRGVRYADSTVYPYPVLLQDTADLVLLISEAPVPTWYGKCDALFAKFSAPSFTNGHEPKDCLAVLDSLMCDINAHLLPRATSYNLAINGPDAPIDCVFPIGELRQAYLWACEEVLTPGSNSYYCNTGEAPVIFDQNVQWDMNNRSAGGWSDISPENEEDYKTRNNLELDPVLIKQADYELTEKERGYNFTRYIMRERDERAARANAYNNLLKAAPSTHKLLSTMLHIEVAYKRSLLDCERLGSFTGHNLTTIFITRKQLDTLRETFKTRFNQLPRPCYRRTIYLMYCIGIHQCDRNKDGVKASQRIMKVFRSIKKDTVGDKYYAKLAKMKDRMFKHILRNINKISAPAEKNMPMSSMPDYLNTPLPLD